MVRVGRKQITNKKTNNIEQQKQVKEHNAHKKVSKQNVPVGQPVKEIIYKVEAKDGQPAENGSVTHEENHEKQRAVHSYFFAFDRRGLRCGVLFVFRSRVLLIQHTVTIVLLHKYSYQNLQHTIFQMTKFKLYTMPKWRYNQTCRKDLRRWHQKCTKK